MATFTFDGTASQTVAFNATVDRVVFNLDAADLASLSEDRANNTVTFVATSGAILTLTGTNFAALTGTSLVPGFESDITFSIGGDTGTAQAGNVVVGLAGADTISATGEDADGALVFGNEDGDTITATGAGVRLYGGQGGDTINLNNGDTGNSSLIVGGLGQDTISVGVGMGGVAFEDAITIFGGNEAGDPADGADTISITLSDTGTATIFGNGGNDIIGVTGGNATVYGGQGNDSVTATVDGGLFVGGLGGDTLNITLNGTDASATVFGGNEAGDPTDGNDTIIVSADEGSSFTVYGNGGNDTITAGGETSEGGVGSFQIFGGQGNDVVNGTLGDGSVVYGGLGIDSVNVSLGEAGARADESVTIYGGNGAADAADGADVITVALAVTAQPDIAGIEQPSLTQTAVIYGNGGDDLISVTGLGDATVFGGAGDDSISVAGGQYELTGGAGDDTFNFSGAAAVTDEDTLSSITDFVFGEDEIVFAGTITDTTTVGRATLVTAADIGDIADANGSTGQVAVITVSSGDLAGNYAVLGEQVIEITGFTGTIGAGSFSGLTDEG